MIEKGYQPHLIVYNTILNGLCKIGNTDRVVRFLRMMEARGFEPDIVAYNTVIDCLSKNNLLKEALDLFSEVKVKGIRPHVVTYSCLIHAICNSGQQKEAIRLLNEMVGNNISLDIVTYNILVEAHCKEGMLSEAVDIVDTMRRQGIVPDVVTYIILVDAYCKEGRVSEAVDTINIMRKQGVEPNVVTYSILVDAHCKEGMVSEAEEIVDVMMKRGIQPDFFTYSILIDAHCKKGMVSEAEDIVDSMTKRGIEPNVVTYSTLMQGMCQLGRVSTACELLRKMLASGQVPHLVTFSILLENSQLQFSYQSILRASDGFSMQNLVGSGNFGSAYKGILEESGAAIAVKVLNLLNRGASRSFLAECEAFKNILHRNLVKVLTAISGVDYQGNDFKALVYEFMSNGSLENWLHPSTSINEPETVRNLNFFQRINVAIDVAHALEYLHHHCETSIIHCDLKPSNILLDDEMVGHISDFGLAKVLFAEGLKYSANQSSSVGLRGTIGYAPPEYGMGSELSTKGDVYSYGILLLVTFTGKRPTDERFKDGLSLHNFVKEALPERMIEVLDPILVKETDMHLQCLNSILKIGLTCSAEPPSERMDMTDVVSKLCSIRDKLYQTRFRREVRT